MSAILLTDDNPVDSVGPPKQRIMSGQKIEGNESRCALQADGVDSFTTELCRTSLVLGIIKVYMRKDLARSWLMIVTLPMQSKITTQSEKDYQRISK